MIIVALLAVVIQLGEWAGALVAVVASLGIIVTVIRGFKIVVHKKKDDDDVF